MAFDFEKALRRRSSEHASLLELRNRKIRDEGGACERWENPALTPSHAPLLWRYDLDPRRNPFLVERLGVARVEGASAVEQGGRICLVARLVGKDGRAFFGVAESDSGVEGFRFRERPLELAGREADAEPSDMRVTAHEDGWLYGIFGVGSPAAFRFGVARTRDLAAWERLADLRLVGDGHETVALHPQLVRGQYAFYGRTRTAAGAESIGMACCENVEDAELGAFAALESPYPLAGSPGAPPLRASNGWLHLAQARLPAAAGGGTVLTAFLTELDEPRRVRAAPPGYWLAPGDGEGGVSCAGAVARRTGEVFVYYAVGGALRVATSRIERLVDYTDQEPAEDAAAAAAQRMALLERNLKLVARSKGKAYRGIHRRFDSQLVSLMRADGLGGPSVRSVEGTTASWWKLSGGPRAAERANDALGGRGVPRLWCGERLSPSWPAPPNPRRLRRRG